ncbi:MAG: DUF4974 domain-containing protein [Prevotella sp.]|nr:DUF4974 domain-containing protein [Prevotella sp.]
MSDRIQRLLEITDTPCEFSEEEIQETLQDDDMRASYAVMVMAAQAFDAERETGQPNIEQDIAKTIALASKRSLWRKVAIFVGVFLVSGLAVAAFLPLGKTHPAKEKPAVVGEEASSPQTVDSQIQQKELPLSRPNPIVVFQDETLENIMLAVGEEYNLTPVFKNEQKRHLRLHLKWNREAGLDIFLQRISQFKQFKVTATPTTIIIE